MVPYEYKYPHELKYLPLMTNFNRSTGTYAPEFMVVFELCMREKKERTRRTPPTKLKFSRSIFSTVRKINETLLELDARYKW